MQDEKDVIGINILRNRMMAISSYLREEVVVSHMPITLEIESTNFCNEDCWMCPRKYMERSMGNLSLPLLKRIISQNKGTLELINLFHCGEPLLHPKLGEMISYCHKQGIKVLITTTGELLTKAKSMELINSGLDMIVFSIDAVTPDTYSKIRKGDYKKVVSNIEELIWLKKKYKKGPFVQVQMVKMDINHHEVNAFVKWWNKKADSVRVKRIYNTAGIAAKIGQKLPQRKNKKVAPCIMLWREPVICWDGSVLPCCIDLIGETPLGNIREKSLREIWNGETMRKMRRLHIEGRHKEIDLCNNCTIFQVKKPFLLGSVLLDDITIRKVNPFIERLDTVYGVDKMNHF